LNTTPVRASFHVHPLRGNGEVAPLPPAPFAVSPDSGVVEPSRTQALTFYFQSHAVKEVACQRFQISTPGGIPLVVTCKAFCQPMRVRLSTRSINFGEVACGKIYSRTLQLHNDTERPAKYHFIDADHMRGVFWFDRHIGVIPCNSFMVVTVFFGPLAPVNYYKQLSCVVKGAASPLIVHLIGSAHDDKTRPERLDQKHIDIFKNMQLHGIREHPRPPENSTVQDNAHEEDDESSQDEELPTEVSTFTTSATAMFLETMLPMDSKLRDITVNPANMDFGECMAQNSSDKHLLTVSNRTSQKVTLQWMIPGETRMPCVQDERSLFTVYPPAWNIPPKGNKEFEVTFRAQNSSNYQAVTHF